jgi:hypothetical protein
MEKIISIVLCCILASCFTETKREKIDNLIQDKMYYKAKAASPDRESFGTSGQFYKSSINDSIVFCQQNYHYENVYGKRENAKVYGYFNSRTGEDVTSFVDFYTNDAELSRVPSLIR